MTTQYVTRHFLPCACMLLQQFICIKDSYLPLTLHVYIYIIFRGYIYTVTVLDRFVGTAAGIGGSWLPEVPRGCISRTLCRRWQIQARTDESEVRKLLTHYNNIVRARPNQSYTFIYIYFIKTLAYY